ncbi:GNAT family N-acetyltransferase [Vibrio sp. 10N.247.310.17]|uniref:GNAT family N-acetyltransferase n=1 Tax=Vibrio sp. 10N.247.310.17 TaxID=3229979 RepID=UPI00354FECB3
MNHHLSEHNIAFKTSRLTVDEVSSDLNAKSKSNLLSRTIELLSPQVVKSLPPFFQDISSLELAEIWFKKMTSESRFLVVKSIDNSLTIGFLFLYEGDCRTVHIGYLLGEEYWCKGYAKEFLNGLINWCASRKLISTLVGGVEKANIASAKLLESLGFVEKVGENEPVVFYEYWLSKPKPPRSAIPVERAK